jgi:hypothetical protein
MQDKRLMWTTERLEEEKYVNARPSFKVKNAVNDKLKELIAMQAAKMTE